jgi:hypothetical protein
MATKAAAMPQLVRRNCRRSTNLVNTSWTHVRN